MDLTPRHTPGHPRDHNIRAALGILYAEDFSQLAPTADRASARPTPPPPPAITQSDVDAACIQAVQAAQAAWSTSAAERRAEALAAIAAALADAQAEAAHQAETIADGVARTALAMLAGLLPHFCRAHGDNEVRAIASRFAPLLARHQDLVLRVHPGLIDTLAQDIAELDDTLLIELRPANLAPGDIRMSWADGTLTRDTAAIGAAMQDVLDRLGLDPPKELAELLHEPPKPERSPALQTGSLEHAQ